MRTKTLLLTAAIGAVGLATSMAQVYSVNIVGYVNVTIPHGWSIIANPLNASPDNTLGSIMPTPAQNITIFKFVPSSGTYLVNGYLDFLGSWDDPSMPINPGEGLYVYNDGTNYTHTFVGEVPLGTQSIPLYQGWNLVASKIPQAGLLTADLGYPPGEGGDVVYKYDNATSSYLIFSYFDFLGGWDTEPTVNVGEGFYLYRNQAAPANWSRTFNVN